MMIDWTATWRDLEKPPALTLLPLGSYEQHGPSLPLGTDWYVADHLARLIAQELDAWVLPAQPFSCAQEHQEFPGTITLHPATLAALLADIAESVARAGVPYLAILNFHGGNWALKSIVRDLNRRLQTLTVLAISPYEGTPELVEHEDLHAGAFEASLWLHLRPDLVRQPLQDCVLDVSPALLDQVGLRALSPQGQWGAASSATAERGQRDLDWMAANAVQQIRAAMAQLDALRTQSAQ